MWHGFPAQPVAMCSFETDLIMATGCAGKPCHTFALFASFCSNSFVFFRLLFSLIYVMMGNSDGRGVRNRSGSEKTASMYSSTCSEVSK